MIKAFKAEVDAAFSVAIVNEETGRDIFEQAQSSFANPVLPVYVHHSASVGMDVWLSAIAYGASAVFVLCDGTEASEYRDTLSEQAGISNAILAACAMGTGRIQQLDMTDVSWVGGLNKPLLANNVPAATYAISDSKRTSMEMAIDHFVGHAEQSHRDSLEQSAIDLPSGSPFGAVVVNTGKCTLCMSCAGACPSSALMDNPDSPQLRFLERNCVQCGLCAETCPENAIELQPRLWLSQQARQARVLNESRPFHCTQCAKPFGTEHMIKNMMSKLAGHSMFAGNLNRLQMCADCRVVDMFKSNNEMTIHEVKP